MSLYAEYLMENSNDKIIETDFGFATYRFLNEGKSVYIIDIYVRPEYRRTGMATTLADLVTKEAKERGCTELLGTVAPSHNGSTGSLKFQLIYGMRLLSASQDAIILHKEI